MEGLLALGGVADADLKARHLLARFTLRRALVAEPIALENCIGTRGAKLIQAAHAIAVAAAEEPLRQCSVVTHPEMLKKLLPTLTGNASDERLWALYLNSKGRLIEVRLISRGSPISADLNIRTIIIGALELGATGLILVHNHPSGDPTPSSSDIKSTRMLVDAARSIQVHVYDHLVVAGATIRSILRSDLNAVWRMDSSLPPT